jgi:hypothetical protein
MMFEYRPVPKKPFKGKKKQETFKGRTIPTKRERGKINKSDYQRVIDEHGFECWYCGTTQNLECHHIVFRSQGGRGVWTNLRFLCSEHHRTGKESVHQNKKIMQKLQYEHMKMFGKYYFQDRFDLFKLGLIPTPTKEVYESFMEKERKKSNG